MDEFNQAYLTAAWWSSSDNDGLPLDENYDINDFHPSTLKQMSDDCKAFQAANAEDIAENPAQAGHDFWLTRNGHGSGFWDGDWSGARDRLTRASQRFGSYDLIVGDDGMIHGI